MKHIFIRFHLIFASVILLATLAIVLELVTRYNYRWDATSEKIYSISESTVQLLKKMDRGSLEVLAFYPHDDPSRANFDTFLRECRRHQSRFRYHFYDPDRVPTLAKQYHVKSFYTVVIRYEGRHETVESPTEESFTSALLRLANPKQFNLCFSSGHGEAPLAEEGRSGLSQFRQTLEGMNYGIHEIILLRDRVPDFCNVVVTAGPRHDFDPEEFKDLKGAFLSGRGIFFILDPMDPGAGRAFGSFFREFGLILGEDVIVDKMSRLVGGDFLVPLVNQYVTKHPITENFQKPTFFPVARSLQPADDVKEYEAVPLALTSNGSWAETNLRALEKGEAAFEPTQGDLQGPLPVAAAIERRPLESNPAPLPDGTGFQRELSRDGKSAVERMVVVGDSDFLTNAYVGLSGNRDFALNVVQWLTRDDRFISIYPRQPEFQPLFLTSRQRMGMLLACVAGLPILVLTAGLTHKMIRDRSA